MPHYKLHRPYFNGQVLQKKGAIVVFEEGKQPKTAKKATDAELHEAKINAVGQSEEEAMYARFKQRLATEQRQREAAKEVAELNSPAELADASKKDEKPAVEKQAAKAK